jgi:hypothetical protein
MTETRRAEGYRETRRKGPSGPPIRSLPLGDRPGDGFFTIAGAMYAITGHRADDSLLEALLVLSSPRFPGGMFYAMDAREARMMGETLLKMADEMPGPKPEPEVAEKRDGGGA